MEIHEKPSKTKSKTILGTRKSLFGPFMIFLFVYISYTKRYIINGPNIDFLEPKMVLGLVFDGFSCIPMVYIIQNLKIPDMYRIFLNIR